MPDLKGRCRFQLWSISGGARTRHGLQIDEDVRIQWRVSILFATPGSTSDFSFPASSAEAWTEDQTSARLPRGGGP